MNTIKKSTEWWKYLVWGNLKKKNDFYGVFVGEWCQCAFLTLWWLKMKFIGIIRNNLKKVKSVHLWNSTHRIMLSSMLFFLISEWNHCTNPHW